MAYLPFRSAVYIACFLLILQLTTVSSFDVEELRIRTLRAKHQHKLAAVRELGFRVNTELLENPELFYNYTIVCGKDADPNSRVGAPWDIDNSIPEARKSIIKSTYRMNTQRHNRCPTWSKNLDTSPPTGSMDSLKISEDANVGEVVYQLTASDPSNEPLYYFIRNVENDNSDIIFNISTVSDGFHGFVGKVVLNQKLDADTKTTYNFLVYAYDGMNLIERYSTVHVLNVDDEMPKIITTGNRYYDEEHECFDFEVDENASIGHVLNEQKNRMQFDDIDTPPNLLEVKLVDATSGLSTIPFTMTTSGDLVLTSSLDFEERDIYTLIVIVKDTSGASSKGKIYIKVRDVADQIPLFQKPLEDQEISFLENSVGAITEIKAVSNNSNPLGPITYKISKVHPIEINNKFTLFQMNGSWFLNCTEAIILKITGQDEIVEIEIEAIESASKTIELISVLKMRVRIISGDVCAPLFSKEAYTFEVEENEKLVLADIFVKDCDHGENGKIFLSTSDPNFEFKVDYIYREGHVALEMKKPYDYEQITAVEFIIFARSSDTSLNNQNSSAVVKIEIRGQNEFVPEFVLPKKQVANSQSFFGSEKFYKFLAEENKDFMMSIKAEDLDRGLDGNITYSIERINSDDTFEVQDSFDENFGTYGIKIDGMYLDASSDAPITFIVNAKNELSPGVKLSNEIIVNVKASYSYVRPAYFDKSKYNFDIQEKDLDKVYKLKLINDNLKRSEVEIVKMQDKLDLFKFEFQNTNFLSSEASNFNDERFENENNEELLYLTLKRPEALDIDELYRLNNHSDIYTLILKAQIKDQPSLETTARITFRLIDENDNAPVLLKQVGDRLVKLEQDERLHALVPRSMTPNMPITFQEMIVFSDKDFSKDFGVESVYFKLNDTRFQVDNKLISSQLIKLSESKQTRADTIPFIVRKLTRTNEDDSERLWIEVKGQDSYFSSHNSELVPNNMTFIIEVLFFDDDKEMKDDSRMIVASAKDESDAKEINLWVNQLKSNISTVDIRNSTHSALVAFVSDVIRSNMTESFNIPLSVLKIFNFYQFSVDEAFIGEVGQIVGIDTRNHLAISYKLMDQQDLFSIDNKTGVISTIRGLDFENPSERSIMCNVKAIFDQHDTEMVETNIEVKILVKQVNDNAPEFSSSEYMFTLILDSVIEAGTEIGMVYIKDLDEMDQVTVSFTKVQSLFQLEHVGFKVLDEANFTMAKLLTKKRFARGDTFPEFFTVEIQAHDMIGNKNKAQVRIKVAKVDEKLPTIEWVRSIDSPSADVSNSSNSSETLDFEVKVSNLIESGKAVFKIEAKPEFEIDSPIRYKLITDSELFTLDEETGEILTASNFTDAVKSRSARSVLFVQAFYDSKMSKDNSTIPVWSKVAIVNIDMVQEKMKKEPSFPVFTQPPNNHTRVELRSLKKGNPVYTFKCVSENVTFQYGAAEIFKKGDKEIDQHLKSISLPFFVNARTGELNFNWEKLKHEDLLTIFKHTSLDILVEVTVVAENEDSSLMTPNILRVLFYQEYLFEVHRKLYGDVDLKFTANFPLSSLLKIETFNQLTKNKYVNEIMAQQASSNYVIEQIYLSIKQNTEPNSVIASLKSYLDEQPIQHVPYTFTVSAIESVDHTNLDPSIFFFYNNIKQQIVLIRPLENGFLNRTIRFRLLDTRALTDRESLHKRYDLSVFITDNGFTSKPEITLKAQENLDVLCMLDLDTEASALAQFNAKQVTLNAFEVDNAVNYTVGFNQLKTDSLISQFYELAKNETHILFNRKVNTTLSLAAVERAQETLGRKFFQFTIQLSNKVHSVEYTANLHAYEYKQLKRIVLPKSTRFQGDIQRSKVPNTVINLAPIILVTNPLPFDLNLRLVDLQSPVTEFFDMRPKQVEPSESGTITECVVYLAKSLESSNTTKLWSNIEFKLEFYTQNWYMNQVLNLLREEPLTVDLTIKLDNQFAPEITQVKLMGELMELGDNYTFSLKEGKYFEIEVGSIVALDKDEGDLGRVEYSLIGTSQLKINKTTGVISIDGILDAENEKTIVFFCYARDMATSAVSKQSETVRFTLNVLDVNEFEPMIQTSMQFKALRENKEKTKLPVVLGSVSCFDSDVSADLKLSMESIRYVIDGERISKLDINSDGLYLRNKFDMVFPEETTSTKASVFSREKSTKAQLRLVESIDYERLFRPNETLIEIEFVCTDGELEKKSNILLKIEDMNDNRPTFENTLPAIIEVNETTDLLQPLVKLTASDLDMSKEFGNDSLVYSITDCTPDVYGFYVNFGVVYSRFDLDADTDKMVEARRKDFKGLSLDNSIDISCKVVVSDSFGGPNSLSSEKNLTIRFINMNDNAPVIKVNNLKENTIEVKEGQKSQGKILAQIEIFDRDDASNLVCRFHNGLKTFEYFEFKTEVDITDPFKAWCILKVQDDMWINYDSTKRSNYDFDLVVHDRFKEPVGANNGESKVALRVHVLSVNMRAPMFLNGDEETFYALDSAKNGTVVGTILATDTENSNPEKLIYILNSTNSSVEGISNKFELIMNKKSDFHWGAVELVTKAKLNAKESPYTLVVTAYDGPVNFGTTKSSRKEIKVHVINKGSVSVWVDKETGEAVDYYTKTVDEELPTNTSVITVHAVLSTFNQEDLDETLIIYEIEPHVVRTNSSITINNPYYRINETSGEIFTTGARLDYEEIDSFKKQLMRDLKIKATSTDGLHKYSTRVSLEIVDINDNSPMFNQVTGFCVVENSTSQETVGTIKAEDMDSGLNGEIEYKLNETALNYEDVSRNFEVDRRTGQIFLKTKIDREQNSSIVMSLIASDKGSPEAKSVGIDINICVLDINDNTPVFDSDLPRILSIQENSMLVNFTLKSTDLDFGSNGTIFYYIEEDKSNKFIIDPITQKLNLTTPLDYESLQTFNLTIISSDYGSPKPNLNKLNLKINVQDQNDNGPRFSPDIVKFLDVTVRSFEEEDPEVLVGQFDATDKDFSDAFNQVGYRINTVLSRQLKHNNLPVMDDNRFMNTYSEPLFNFENGTLTVSREILNLTSQNYFLVELEGYDLDNEMLFDRVNVSIVFRLPIRTSEHPILKEMSLLKPKELTISKRVLPAEKNSVGAEDHSFYVVYIIQAEDPSDCGLDYFLDSVEESQMRNSRSSLTDAETELDQMSLNFDDLFKVDMADGIVTATQSRSSYLARFYRLKLRVALKCNPSIEANGYLIVNINSKKESLFKDQVFTALVEENLTNKTSVFDIRAQLSVPNDKLIFEINKDNSMPTNVYNKWFSLDEKIGIVHARSGDEENMIDYEAHSEVLLGINVVDTRTFDFVETVVLKIHVQDLNDNAPIFDVKYNYNPIVNEDDKRTVSEDRLMTKIRAIDFDGTSENSALSYSIVAVIPAVFKRTDFKIERISDTDVFGLYKRAGVDLDRDSMNDVQGPIRIILEVADNGKPEVLTAQKEVLIKIHDVNDNPPRILNKKDFEQEIILFEDQKLGVPVTKISADDLDEGNNAILKYEIISERTQMPESLTKEKTSHFSINKNGEIFLIEELDYEHERQTELIVRISDISTQPLGVKQTILFSIQNVNDNAPVFLSFPTIDNNGRCRLEIEESRSNEVFYQFKASDADDFSGPFKFEILEISSLDKNSPDFERMSIEDNVFNLGLTSGELTLAAHHQLDRESVDNYKILIRLRDQEILGKQLETLKECHIQIKDINDNAPQFMPEQIGTNNTVLRVFPLVNEVNVINWFGATDLDLGNNGTIEYELVYNDNLTKTVSHVFTIDERGYLLINGNSLQGSNVFDLDDIYSFSVIARDMGVPRSLESKINLLIEIDENYFRVSKSVDRLELDTVNGKTLFQLEENSEIGTELAQVVIQNSFLKNQTEVSRNHVQLNFKLLTCNDTFTINELTGLIAVKDNKLIDFEAIKQFLITVEATEMYILNQVEKRRQGTMIIIVKVNNVNDNSPTFNKEAYVMSVSENIFQTPFALEESSDLIQITDNDLKLPSGTDLPKFQNAALNVQLKGSDSHKFTLERIANISSAYSSFYRLVALSPFDAEHKQMYELDINVFDGQTTVMAPLTIRIKDVNDNSPRFNEIVTNLDIDENLSVGTPIITVKAFDADKTTEMNQTNYRITSITANKLGFNLNSIFTIDRETGQIQVASNQLIDRELFEYFNVTVRAFNPHDERMHDEVALIFRLNDLNDNKPVFDEAVYQMTIREKSLFPRAIMDLGAVDLDLGTNAHVTYFIKKMNGKTHDHRDTFYIETDKLMLNKFIDLDTEPADKHFELIIRAEDKGGLSDETTVLIDVLDVNDHAPKIDMNKMDHFEIVENNARNESLFFYKCIDPDFSRAELRYELVPDLNGDWRFFNVDVATGEVKANTVFDFEEKREYNLRFKCTDLNGIMILHPVEIIDRMKVLDESQSFPLELSSTHDMQINIIDLDDNEPEFGRFVITRNVSDSLRVGENIDLDPTVAFIPTANDRDFLPENRNITYFIVSGNEEAKFSLNRFTGELKLVQELERTLRDVYHLKIRATSQKNLSLDLVSPTSVLKVVINVVAGDLFIEFADSNYYISTPKSLSMKADFQHLRQYQFSEIRNIADPSNRLPTSRKDYRERLETGSIFFSRAHLIQRKAKRSVRFSIELVQLARKGSNNLQRLPMDTVNSSTTLDDEQAHELMLNAVDLKLDSERVNLFDIDSYTGKIYINREYLSDMEYNYGDTFILTVVATAYKHNSRTVLSRLENTVTRLFVRISERDYSLVIPVTNNLKAILQDNLNPLKEKYIPRLLETDGLRLTIQDLVLTTSNVVKETDNSLYNVIIQVETNMNHRPCDLDGFADIWSNFSISPVYFDTFSRVTERQMNKRGQADEDLAFLVEPRKERLIYNPIFWFVVVAVLLVMIVIMFCVNCYCLKKTIKKNNKKSGLLIEYPPGYTPIYKDGVLNLNAEANKETDSNYEDQELIMNIEEQSFNKTLDRSKLSEY